MLRRPRFIVLIPVLAAVVSLVTLPAVSVAAPTGVTVQRIFGADRYATSAAIARATFGTSTTQINKAVIANGNDFPDAAVGANLLSGYYGPGPVLLTRANAVPQPIVDVIKALAIPPVLRRRGNHRRRHVGRAAAADLGRRVRHLPGK